jgi:hypothetical protein
MSGNLPDGVTDRMIDEQFGGNPMCTCGRRWDDHTDVVACPDCFDGLAGDDEGNNWICRTCNGSGRTLAHDDSDGLPPCKGFVEDPDHGRWEE